MKLHAGFALLAMALALAPSAHAQDVTLEVEGSRATASQGSNQAQGELTPAEQHVLQVADAAQRAEIGQLAAHRLLGLPLRVSGRLVAPDGQETYRAQLQGELLTYSLTGFSSFGPLDDALNDMGGASISLSGLVTLSDESVAPLDSKPGQPYFAEPIYTQWPQQRRAEIALSDLLGPSEDRAGRIEGDRLVAGADSIRLVGTTARWLLNGNDGARVVVRGQVIQLQPEPVFVVSHVQARVKKWTKLESPSPLGGLSLPLRSSKKARWFTARTYGENMAFVAPGGRLLLDLESRSGFVKTSALALIEPPAGQESNGFAGALSAD